MAPRATSIDGRRATCRPWHHASCVLPHSTILFSLSSALLFFSPSYSPPPLLRALEVSQTLAASVLWSLLRRGCADVETGDGVAANPVRQGSGRRDFFVRGRRRREQQGRQSLAHSSARNTEHQSDSTAIQHCVRFSLSNRFGIARESLGALSSPLSIERIDLVLGRF